MGATIAHGFLTLSLLSVLSRGIFEISDASRRINYGFERLRFVAPVYVNNRIRLRMVLVNAQPKGDGLMLHHDCTLEIEGGEKPALAAQWISLAYP